MEENEQEQAQSLSRKRHGGVKQRAAGEGEKQAFQTAFLSARKPCFQPQGLFILVLEYGR